jgi:hypothetical protein
MAMANYKCKKIIEPVIPEPEIDKDRDGFGKAHSETENVVFLQLTLIQNLSVNLEPILRSWFM